MKFSNYGQGKEENGQNKCVKFFASALRSHFRGVKVLCFGANS